MVLMRPSLRAASLLCVAVLAAVGTSAQTPPAVPLRLVTADGVRPLPTVMAGDTELIAFDDITSAFHVLVREDAAARAIAINYKGRTVVVSQDQALASISGRLVSLPAPPTRIANRWYVPVEFIGRALAPIYDVPLELRKASRLVLLGQLRAPRVVVRYEPAGTQSRVTMDVVPRTPHQVSQDGQRLLVKFEADLLDATLPPIPPPATLVSAIRLSDATTIAVDLGPRFASFRAADTPTDPDGTRVTLELFAAPDQTATPPANPGVPGALAPESPPLLPPSGVRTIVIDPGHGGDEQGAAGAKGTLEKTITLGVARRLKVALESRLGARVLLTRDDDRSIGLDERAAIANNNKADLFVSLHANASLRRGAAGAEVFYLSLDRADEEARRVAESEGAAMPVFGGGTREINVILWEMAQARHLDESAALARAVEQQLRTSVPMGQRAIQQAPFRVLVGANMPAVLVEMGYLTNATQETQLASSDMQGRIAAAITEAISRFFLAQAAGLRSAAPSVPSPGPPR
jgi:N-acetylmuramoyl-L-alanine amidase